MLAESYFCGPSLKFRPESLFDHFDYVNNFITFYDEVEDYLQRCRDRSGRDLTIEWASNSAGWQDNGAFKRVFRVTPEQVENKEGSSVERLDINAPRDWLIHKMKEFV